MRRVFDLANLILLFLAGIFVYSSYPRLPERIPMHFDLAGRPDRWGGRGSIFVLFVFALVMTTVFYLLIRFIPRLAANPRSLNIPHKEEFLKLPAEKQETYWAIFKEFFAGLAAAINLLFYLIIRGTVRIATGETRLLPFKLLIPAFLLIVLVAVYYFVRLITRPGKLVRGEE
jgi:uncharacterized membrane protein